MAVTKPSPTPSPAPANTALQNAQLVLTLLLLGPVSVILLTADAGAEANTGVFAAIALAFFAPFVLLRGLLAGRTVAGIAATLAITGAAVYFATGLVWAAALGGALGGLAATVYDRMRAAALRTENKG